MADEVELGGCDIDVALLAPDVHPPDDAALVAFLARLNTEAQGEMVPEAGWRVLRDSDDHLTVAAYDGASEGWTIVSLRRTNGEYEWLGTSYGRTPRATAQDRGRDFELRFAADEYEMVQGAEPNVTVVVANHSRASYDGSQHLAFGAVRDVGSTEWGGRSGGWFGYAPLTRVTIPAGESLEVPVVFTRPDWPAGEYEIRAVVADLALTVEGARLHVRSR